jgi:hypothetical protein
METGKRVITSNAVSPEQVTNGINWLNRLLDRGGFCEVGIRANRAERDCNEGNPIVFTPDTKDHKALSRRCQTRLRK